ncbi:MAG: hypothetical protein WAZ60_24010 [Desulfosalsimonadaceae bacterium]
MGIVLTDAAAVSGTGTPLSSLIASIAGILQDSAYTDLVITGKINAVILKIAGGIRMPNGETSPPLPDLYAYGTVNTSITLPYVSLPTNYQRKASKVYDSSNNQIAPPRGGDYYAFSKFMQQINDFSLAETGSIYRVCIKGSRVYYQGIPSASTTLGLHYYRKPATLALDGDIPEGIPEHLQEDLIKHGVLKDVFGEKIEDGQDNAGIGTKYHTGKFFEAMTALCDFVGIDGEPQYYGEDGFEDGGVCD